MNKNNNKIEADYSEDRKAVTIRVCGYFTFSSALKFRKTYEAQPSCNLFNLDLAGVTKFDSAGLGCILVMYEFIKHNNKQAHLNICNADKNILEIFECAKVSHLLDDIRFDMKEPEIA